MAKTAEPAAETEEELETPGDWDFLAYEWKALKFESVHLFQDEDELIPISNFALSSTFYVCAVLAFVLLTTMYRCEVIENQVGVQKVKDVADCENFVTVTCVDACGKVYADAYVGLGMSDYYPLGQLYPISETTWSPQGTFHTSYNVFCTMDSYSGDEMWYFTVDSYIVYSDTKNECEQSCSQFVVGDTTVIYGSGRYIAAVDCSCDKIQPCTCDDATGRGVGEEVKNPPSCKNYLELKDTEYSIVFPIDQCDGILREVIECKDFITLVGTFGGYVSLLYSAAGVLFFILLSRAKFFKKGRKKKTDEDLELHSLDSVASTQKTVEII